MAATDPIDHGASFFGLATGLSANHCAQAGVTTAPRVAVLIVPELLTGFVVVAVVVTAAAPQGDALVSTEDVTVITLAGLHAGLPAGGGGSSVRAAGGAGVPTGLIVAVLRAGQGWDKFGKGRFKNTGNE